MKTYRYQLVSIKQQDALAIDRLSRMLQEINVNYERVLNPITHGYVTLFALGRISKPLHAELKARCFGVLFALEHEADMLTLLHVGDITEEEFARCKFVTLPSEEVSL